MAAYRIFISYAHQDEPFKDQLTQQLKGLRRQGLIAPWDDRCIDGGKDWRNAIASALDACDLALLLVSPAFIASDFIYTDELSRLLERRERDGIRVVPVILRPCAWRHETAIDSLQVRPINGKPIISFSPDDGARDQVWCDIVDEIVGWAKQGRQAVAPAATDGPEPVHSLLSRLRRELIANSLPDVEEATRQRILRHPPASLDEYRMARWAEWSQRRYAVDKRFTRLTLLVDQGPDAQGPRWCEQPREFQDLQEVLHEVDNTAIVLLGPPGCGKSTLLRRLELDLAVDALRAPEAARLSLFLSLSRYRPRGDGALPGPRAWIEQEWQRPQHRQLPAFSDALASGRVVLLLDGVNEMPSSGDADYRKRIESWSEFLAELARDAPGTRVVFSCRALDYSTPLSAPGQAVPHVRIKALNDAQVEEFLALYSAERGTALWAQLKGTRQLEVFRSPFYLRLLVEQPDAGTKLRTGRAGLFTSFVRAALLREIEDSKTPLFKPVGLLSARDYPRILRREWDGAYELAKNSPLFTAISTFAARLQARSGTSEARVRVKYADALVLLGEAAGEAILEAGAALEVLDIVGDDVFFRHQLLQEYFAGRALVAALQPQLARTPWRSDEMHPPLLDAVAGLADSDPLPAAPTTGWEETFIIAAAMAGDPEIFVSALAEHNLPLAGRCAAQPDVALSDTFRSDLAERLIQRSRDPEADLRARIAAARALGDLGDPRFVCGRGPYGDYLLPPVVPIPGGQYPIGSDEGHCEGEAPVQTVTLAPFALGRFPVTNAEWRMFMGAGGYDDERWWETEAAKRWRRGEGTAEGPKQVWRAFRKKMKENPSLPQLSFAGGRITSVQAENWAWYRDASDQEFEALLGDWYPTGRQTQPMYWDDPAYNHPSQPVVGICWYEARAYCAWLGAQTGRDCRLPSEAEWEAAAHGLSARCYAWGYDFDPARCNAFETHVRGTTPVGVFPGGDTIDGLTDLTGNVWEWSSSLYQFHVAVADLEDTERDGPRVLRGGSWNLNCLNCRCASRYTFHPGLRPNVSGFRVCLAPLSI